jgi:hypothetical protein
MHVRVFSITLGFGSFLAIGQRWRFLTGSHRFYGRLDLSCDDGLLQ